MSGTSDSHVPRIYSGRSVLVFDTTIAPEKGPSGEHIYNAITGHCFTDDSNGSHTPFRLNQEEVDVFKSGELVFYPDGQSISIKTRLTVSGGLEIHIAEMSDAFFMEMESLPDNPESYAMVDDPALQYISGLNAVGRSFWEEGDGGNIFYDGSVTYGARLVTELEPEACSPADLNQDGIVDFFDISIFIQLFMQGCP